MSTTRTPITVGAFADAEPAIGLAQLTSGWTAITLPLDVHRQLVAGGRIADPDRGQANDACTWVQDRAWWFRFALPDSDGDLSVVIDRLDTQATIYLDGQLLGTHANAFRPAVLALPAQLRNATLTIRIDPPALDDDGTHTTAMQLMRKPLYGFGWDFAPVRPSIGIGSITLVRRDRAALGAVQVRTLAIGDTATLQVIAPADGDARVHVRLVDPDGREVSSAVGTAGEAVQLEVANPRLWWTHDRGEPALHVLHCDLVVDGEVVDSATRTVGIRTIALDRSPDEDAGGEHFRFVLNGELVASFGANWAPCGMSPAAPDQERTEQLLTLARDAGMSMLRIWGGGYFEPDAFYETCDRLGLLIWHDFMFANREYPVDAAYLAEIEAEATYQVQRLSSHPCLALWCGSNEIELAAQILHWGDPHPSKPLFHELLPAVVNAHSDLPYVRSSPCDDNATDRGDRHNWQVWHGLDVNADPHAQALIDWCVGRERAEPDDPTTQAFLAAAHPRRYLDDVTRFASEYGIGSYPALATLEHWLDPASLEVHDPDLLARSRPGRLGPQNKVELFLGVTVGVPDTLPAYVRATQLMQAEYVKLATEHYRRLWPYCSGELLWQLDDCWPAISWSLIDIDRRPKPAWFYARRFYAPLLASVKPVDGGVEVWLTNNSHECADEHLEVRTTTFTGEVLWSATVPVSSEPGTSRAVGAWSLADVHAGPGTYLTVTGRAVSNRHLFTDLVDAERPAPTVTFTEQRDGDALSVTVSTDALALMVHVNAGDAVFDDAFFDVHPGRPRTVTARGVATDAVVTVTAS